MVDEELYNRLIDRYTSVELIDALDVPVSRVIDAFWDDIQTNYDLLEEIGGVEFEAE